MDKLPFYILETIFTQLHFVYKLECRLVCHYWNTIITEFVLLQTLLVRPGSGSLEILDKIQREEWKGNRLRHLLIHRKDTSVSSINLRLDVLSWLRSIFLQSGLNLGQVNLSLEATRPLFRHIEHIVDLVNAQFALQILTLGTCPNLKKLVLHRFGSTEEKSMAHSIFSLLKNAPNLKVLSISGFNPRFSDLETIHSNLPHLYFFSMEFTLLNDVVPRDVAPASALTEFFMRKLSRNVDFEPQIMEYILSFSNRLADCNSFLADEDKKFDG